MSYLREEFELDRVEDYFKSVYNDFSLVTSNTESTYMIDEFSYINNNAVYEIDTRLSNYNYAVNNDFWNFNYEMLQDWLNEINTDNYFSIVHYKGKKFFILENALKFNDNMDGSYTYIIHDNKKKREVLKKLINALELTLKDEEIKGIVYNELQIGGYEDACYTAEYYTNLNFNISLLSRLYDGDLFECSCDILDNVDYDNVSLYDAVYKAYKKVLHREYVSRLESNRKFNEILDYSLAVA